METLSAVKAGAPVLQRGSSVIIAGAFSPLVSGYLRVYGWTRNPLVDYLMIVDSWR